MNLEDAEQVPPATPPPEPQPSPAEQLVDAWFAETFHNVPLDVALFNRFYAARETLKARLAALPRE